MFYHPAPYNPARFLYVLNTEIAPTIETGPLNMMHLMVAKIWYLYIKFNLKNLINHHHVLVFDYFA